MTDWTKLKVTDLKEELKNRGIPLTGLKLKQQLIDRLVELEGPETSNRVPRDAAENDAIIRKSEITKAQGPWEPAQAAEEKIEGTEVEVIPATIEKNGNKEAEAEVVSKSKPESPPSSKEETASPVEEDSAPTVRRSSQGVIEQATNHVTEYPTPDVGSGFIQEASTENMTMEDQNITVFAEPETPQPPVPKTTTALPPSGVSTPIPVAEMQEDSRKRKRRSLTPPPTAEDIAAKKAKIGNSTPIVTQRATSSGLEEIQQASDAAQTLRSATGLDKRERINMTAAMPEETPELNENEDLPLVESKKQAPEAKIPPSVSAPIINKPERYVVPARHPATCSLYLRNFKRPLHIPTLRTHIASLAASLSETDPISTFYLDNIRTHAFVIFTSIAAASRVRSAMHDTRFPDEAMREPLWVDFVPDEKVQGWIDEEKYTSGGANGGKYEVVYEDGVDGDGVEAKLQAVGVDRIRKEIARREAGAAAAALRRAESFASASGTSAVPATGVHPDRARFVPQDPVIDQPEKRKTSYVAEDDAPLQAPKSSDAGAGFKALDELFSFTASKPKLYFKPVSSAQAEARRARFTDLKNVSGQTGEEGMKRYTFESVGESGKEREEWIDKGPEFGFGPRGVDILEGRRGIRGAGGGGVRRGGVARGGARYDGERERDRDRDRGGGRGGGRDGWTGR